MSRMDSRTRGADPRSVRDIVVLGAGPTGLTTALLLARAGCAVTVLDRDPATPGTTADQAWADWSRPGVNQFRHVHIALPRWYRLIRDELPDVGDTLLALGGRPMNLLHLHPESATGGRQDGDEQFDTVTARRPVIEAALASAAAAEAGLTVRRGERASGLVMTPGARGDRRVVGVRVGPEVVEADLVVDATGHRTPVPGWLARLGLAPVEARATVGLTYYTRHLRSPDGPPTGTGGALTHHASYAVLTLPADNGAWGLALIVSSTDSATRRLRESPCWAAALRASGVDERWLTGTPLDDVRPLAGLQDVVRDYAPGGPPVVDGLVAVGDAWATTSPFLGRGLSLGAMQAVALRDAVADRGSGGSLSVADGYATLLRERVVPYLQATLGFGRHRVAEMAAEAAGQVYRTEDPAWAGSTALAAGAQAEPVLLRAHARIASLVALPADVFADPEVRKRVGPWFGTSPYPRGRPGRAALLEALDTPHPHHPSRRSTVMTTTTISLADLSGATADYLRTEVEVRLSEVTRNLGRGADGTFTVRIRNADRPRGIRLTDVTVHLQIDSPAVILLSAAVPTVMEARATGDRDDPRLPSDARVGEMFVFFPQASAGFEPNDVLEPGETIEFEVGYHGESAGTTDITAHLHASISFDDLFPRSNSTTVERSVTIRP